MLQSINSITFGIRYSRTFTITELFGQISDDVLYNNKSPLKEKFDIVSKGDYELTLEKRHFVSVKTKKQIIILE